MSALTIIVGLGLLAAACFVLATADANRRRLQCIADRHYREVEGE